MHPLPDDLDLLLALDVLLRERHVTRAALRLGITQGAASQKLARLREFFQDRILVPGRPLLIPTPRAQAIARPLAQALAALRAAVQVAAPFDPATSERRFVLLGNDLVESHALPPLLEDIALVAPHVTVSVERVDLDFAERLENGTADAAFVPDFLVSDSMRRRGLPPEHFVVVVRQRHPVTRARFDLERYLELGHVLIAPRGAPGSVVDGALEKLGRKRRVVARVQHFVSAPLLIASSDLALTCPESVFRAAASFLPLTALRAPLDLPIDRTSIVWHERSQDDVGHVWLRSRIERVLQGVERSAKKKPRRLRQSVRPASEGGVMLRHER